MRSIQKHEIAPDPAPTSRDTEVDSQLKD